MWIQLLTTVELGGVVYQPGYRLDVDRVTGQEFVRADDARSVDGPYESRKGEGYDRAGWDFDAIDGIGDKTAEELYRSLDDRHVRRKDQLDEVRLERFDGFDDTTAAKVREHVASEE